nr:ribosomal protein L22 [Anthoceros agrestis]
MKTNYSNLETQALAKHIRISASKVRRVINEIRGRSYEQALMILEFMPYRACYPVSQLLSSAAANASHNLGLNKADLVISEVKVDEGTMLKRFEPRAQGRGYPIHKPTSHITIVIKKKST